MLRRWLEAWRAWWLAPVLEAIKAAADAERVHAAGIAKRVLDLAPAIGAVSAQLDAVAKHLTDLEKAHNRLATEQGWRYDHTVAALESNEQATRHLSLRAFGTEPPARQWREVRQPREFTHADRQ